MVYKIIFIFIISLFVSGNLKVARAQDTFGPVCDGITVTCPPSPIPTAPPVGQPEPSPTLAELPRAGIRESLYILIFVAAGLIVTGIITHVKLQTNKRAK